MAGGRYRTAGEFDDPGGYDGDSGFVGMDSKSNPAILSSGRVAFSKNMRFDRMTARTRKGAIAQNIGIHLEFPPVVLPFLMPEEGVTLYEDYNDGARTAGVYHGSMPMPEPLEFMVNRMKVPATCTFRGREYQLHVTGGSSRMERRDYLMLVFSDKIYMFDPEQAVILMTFDIPENERIPGTDQIHIVQAFDQVILFRGKDENGNHLRPLYWDGTPGGKFEYAPPAEAYYDIPSSSYGLWFAERLIVPLEYQFITLEKLTVSSETKMAKCQVPQDTNFRPGMKITIAGAETAGLNGEKTITKVTAQEWEDETGEDGESKPVLKTPASFEFAYDSDVDFEDKGEAEARYESRDEYVVSGILTPFDYNWITGHFRINKGTNDYLVGFAPYQEDSMIVFMRNSVHIHSGLYSIDTSTRNLITEEVGCVSRRTIATIGSQIFFLADNGVYSLVITTELNLHGAGEPLSKDIDDHIKRINISAASKACAVFCDNRYYLAVPVDGSTRNNAIFVYNMLNRAWESIDEYPPALYFDELVVAICRGQKRVFGVSREGGITLLEEKEKGDEVGIIGADAWDISPVNGQITTRNYSMGSPDIKRFRFVQTDIAHETGDEWSIQADMENPDGKTVEWEYAADENGETTIKNAIRKNAHRCQVIFKTKYGRPELRQVALEGSIQTRDNRIAK